MEKSTLLRDVCPMKRHMAILIITLYILGFSLQFPMKSQKVFYFCCFVFALSL